MEPTEPVGTPVPVMLTEPEPPAAEVTRIWTRGVPLESAEALTIKVVTACASCQRPAAVVEVTVEPPPTGRSEEHTSELQSLRHLVCRLLLEKKKERNR